MEAHRVSWIIYTCLFVQYIDGKTSMQAGCAVFPEKMYLQALGVSTWFCHLHHVNQQAMLKRSHYFLLFVACLGTAMWGGDVLGDRRYQISVVGEAPLYSLPPHEYPSSNPKISTLRTGEHLRVLRVRYGKDFEALKVETDDGHVGWVIGGKGINVVSRG